MLLINDNGGGSVAPWVELISICKRANHGKNIL